jgi:hypothetical protein
MVCALGYVSEYVQGCDISKLGEGCEKCVQLFKSEWMLPVGIIALAVLLILTYYLIFFVFPRNSKVTEAV